MVDLWCLSNPHPSTKPLYGIKEGTRWQESWETVATREHLSWLLQPCLGEVWAKEIVFHWTDQPQGVGPAVAVDDLQAFVFQSLSLNLWMTWEPRFSSLFTEAVGLIPPDLSMAWWKHGVLAAAANEAAWLAWWDASWTAWKVSTGAWWVGWFGMGCVVLGWVGVGWLGFGWLGWVRVGWLCLADPPSKGALATWQDERPVGRSHDWLPRSGWGNPVYRFSCLRLGCEKDKGEDPSTSHQGSYMLDC